MESIICINTTISNNLDDKVKTLKIYREKSYILLEKLNKVSGLTIGKKYDIVVYENIKLKDSDKRGIFYIIIDDNGNRSKFSSERFKSVYETRQEKLRQLGI